MAIVYPNDKLRIRASNNSKNVSISVDTLSKMSIRRTEDSKASLKGSNFTNVALNNLEVVSVLMNLNLYADNDSLIMATTNQSRVTLNSNSTEVRPLFVACVYLLSRFFLPQLFTKSKYWERNLS